jgi:hypothetical protein
MRRLIFLFALLASSLSGAYATTIGTSAVTAQGAFTLNSGDVLTLRASLVQCSNGVQPYYNAQPISITPNQTLAAPFTANSAQTVTFTVPGNDAVTCGPNGPSYSLYAISWYDNGFPIAPAVLYRLTDASTLVLSQLTPVSFTPPVIGNSAGAVCPAATPIFTGFNSQYQIQCAAGTVAAGAMPVTGGAFAGNVSIPGPFTFNTYLINGIPQADQFAGVDFCTKLKAADTYALANSLAKVDATHFTSAQSCSVDPFNALGTGTVNLEIDLPASTITSTVLLHLGASGVKLVGQGRGNTVFLHSGTSSTAFFTFGQTASYTQFTELHDFSVIGAGPTNDTGTDFLVINSHRNLFSNMSFWSAVTGFQTQGAVSDTFYRLRVSNEDAASFGWSGEPTLGLYFNAEGGNQTTAGTVIDPAVETVSACGITLASASSMVFTAGTSEENAKGVCVLTGSKFNTFVGMDIEGNTANAQGDDINDLGQANTYQAILAASTCSGCASVYADGGAVSIIIGEQGLLTSYAGEFNVFGDTIDLTGSEGNTSLWNVTTKGLTVGVNASVTGTLGVTGAATLSSTLAVTGLTTATGGLTAPNTAPVTHAITTSNDGAVSLVAGTGITSVTCVDLAGSGQTCTNQRGTLKIVNSSATTTSSFAQISFSTTLSAKPVCMISQIAGPAWYGLYVSVVSTALFDVANQNSLTGSGNFYISYYCEL